jgi:hypothetical protein
MIVMIFGIVDAALCDNIENQTVCSICECSWIPSDQSGTLSTSTSATTVSITTLPTTTTMASTGSSAETETITKTETAVTFPSTLSTGGPSSFPTTTAATAATAAPTTNSMTTSQMYIFTATTTTPTPNTMTMSTTTQQMLTTAPIGSEPATRATFSLSTFDDSDFSTIATSGKPTPPPPLNLDQSAVTHPPGYEARKRNQGRCECAARQTSTAANANEVGTESSIDQVVLGAAIGGSLAGLLLLVGLAIGLGFLLRRRRRPATSDVGSAADDVAMRSARESSAMYASPTLPTGPYEQGQIENMTEQVSKFY